MKVRVRIGVTDAKHHARVDLSYDELVEFHGIVKVKGPEWLREPRALAVEANAALRNGVWLKFKGSLATIVVEALAKSQADKEAGKARP